MYNKEWNILLVDDDPDILSVTRLAMRNLTVYGLPLKIHSVTSKAEAIQLLQSGLSRPGGLTNLEVTFIDVVMENDQAGLELCDYIRHQMKNKTTQIYIRTGQPGLAPEREVIDRFDISGYFTKVEATEDKLYTLVKSGVRQAYYMFVASTLATALDWVLANAGSRAGIRESQRQIAQAVQFDAEGHKLDTFALTRSYIVVDGQLLGDLDPNDEEKVLAHVARFDESRAKPIGPSGDKYTIDENNIILIKIAEGPANAQLFFTGGMSMIPPEEILDLVHRYLRAVSILWHQAR
jgi:CheY-like chemotaxis protein